MPNLGIDGTKPVIAICDCRDCGKPVSVKIDKKGKAYAYCPHSDEDSSFCGGISKWGHAESQRFQRAFIENDRQPLDGLPKKGTTHDEEFKARAQAAKQTKADAGADAGDGRGTNVPNQPRTGDDWDLYKAYG